MAKQKAVKVITNRDKEVMNALRCTGYLSRSNLKDDLKMTDRRIKSLIKDKYLEKVSYYDKATKSSQTAFRIGQKGKTYMEREHGASHWYKSNSVNHDLAVAKQYFSCTENERENWITEGQWRERFLQEHENLRWQLQDGLISPADGGYIAEDGRTVMIEITTNHYGQEEIQSKESFATTVGGELKMIKA